MLYYFLIQSQFRLTLSHFLRGFSGVSEYLVIKGVCILELCFESFSLESVENVSEVLVLLQTGLGVMEHL